MRSGSLRGSIYWVLLVSGRFCLSKTIISEAQEHFLTPLARRDTHPFGGLGVKHLGTEICQGDAVVLGLCYEPAPRAWR